MLPVVWSPPAETSPAEQAVIKAVRRAKLFVFLRLHRHELFDEEFQAEPAETYVDSPEGQPPVPSARLALATIPQAYTKVSDDEVIEATVMDRRWQLVLDCMGAQEPPFSKGTLAGFRQRLIEHDLDRGLIERTVEAAVTDERNRARRKVQYLRWQGPTRLTHQTGRVPLDVSTTTVVPAYVLTSGPKLVHEVWAVIAREDPRQLIEQVFPVMRRKVREERADQFTGLVRLSTVGSRAIEHVHDGAELVLVRGEFQEPFWLPLRPPQRRAGTVVEEHVADRGQARHLDLRIVGVEPGLTVQVRLLLRELTVAVFDLERCARRDESYPSAGDLAPGYLGEGPGERVIRLRDVEHGEALRHLGTLSAQIREDDFPAAATGRLPLRANRSGELSIGA